MTILTKLSNLITSAIELPNALHACVEMAREADYSRHEMAKLPSELNEELEQKQCNLDRWRSWAVSMSGMDDDAQSWQLRDEIKRKLADDDGTKICSKLAARIVELERDLNREREARRWRRLKVDDGVDGLTIVLFRQPSGSASRDTRTTLRMHLTEERYPGCEWRYLSPENMP